MRRITMAAVAVLTGAVLATSTGCTRVRLQDLPDTSRSTTRTDVVPLAGAKTLTTELDVAVGELTVSAASTGTTDAMKADFTYSPESWQPQVSYGVADGIGQLLVKQPDDIQAPAFHGATNTWRVQLAGGVPTQVKLRLGVGTSRVDLNGVDVTDLDAITGVGETTIDLSGPRSHDVKARIESGVGRLVIRVPRNVGVRATGRQDGVGSYDANGFIAQGDTWVNSAYAGTGPKIEIDLTRGVGSVSLVTVD